MAKVRISAVSFKCGPIKSFDDFAEHVSRLAGQAAADGPDLVIFPELFTGELMNFFQEPDLGAKFQRLATYTGDYLSLFTSLAKEKSLYIVGGSHYKEVGGKYYNTSHLFTPEGQVLEQRKVHLFPAEKPFTTPGDGFVVFETEKAKVSILTCYDLEFPEPARLAALQGAEILLSPSATLDEAGYWRVRHCAQARCIEDQVFVAHCSLLGGWGMPGLEFWGRASILAPCDTGLPPKGIVAESEANQESVISGEVETETLYAIREAGSATTLKDRRWDLLDRLYRLESKGRS